MKLQKLIIIALSTAISFTAVADEAKKNDADTSGRWNYEGSLELVNLDSEQAAQEFVKDSATAIGVYVSYVEQDWVTTLRGSFIIYSDLNKFSQVVETSGGFNNGDIDTASSDANAFSLGVATGRQWRLGETEDTRLMLQAGYDHVLASERAIASCSNCYSEDIEIDGGIFVQGALKHNFGVVSAGFIVSQYVTGDGLSNRIGITIGSKF